MKKLFLSSIALFLSSMPIYAGGILTNTNQHAAFLRMLARGASIGIDGVYSNPAGLSFLPHDGLYLSLTNQSAYQSRNIDASFKMYAMNDDRPATTDFQKYYRGKASAPFIPSIHAAYKQGDWTLSAFLGVTGGGGKASFDEGLPLFSSLMSALIFKQTAAAGKPLSPQMYDIYTSMNGKQFIYGLQLGLSYRFNSHLSAFFGGRMNYFYGGYEGFVKAQLIPSLGGKELASIKLDCDQTGWGLTPVIGLDYQTGRWNFAAKYEFKTNMNIENKTKVLESPDPSLLAPYADGVNTPSDIPSLLTVAAGYQILPTWRVNGEFHFFDDKRAGMANDKQKALTRGTFEYQAGTEYDLTKQLTVSGGIQFTDYGLSDDFQSDTSFYCDSYSLGFGAAVKLTTQCTLNIAYFWTKYQNYVKSSKNYNRTGLPGTDVYSRTNKVFGFSVEYAF
ncbi:OmpP1/FadL family transporter [Phocaeicola abscessus]|uniref:OmpP1/FadL family transporter n=1 Tax=Phocaeicola abscessus TaxID=555313 RepID=UPI0004BB281C|nr:outer membrane beta-barrel protein [Phocaeicola abscessus]